MDPEFIAEVLDWVVDIGTLLFISAVVIWVVAGAGYDYWCRRKEKIHYASMREAKEIMIEYQTQVGHEMLRIQRLSRRTLKKKRPPLHKRTRY